MSSNAKARSRNDLKSSPLGIHIPSERWRAVFILNGADGSAWAIGVHCAEFAAPVGAVPLCQPW